MKVTIDLPADLLRQATSKASSRGFDFNDFVVDALMEKLASKMADEASDRWPVPPPDIPDEDHERVDKAIEEAFEQIESEDCPNYIA